MLDLREKLEKFLETTTIHGIGHVFNRHEPRSQRLIWAVATIFAFYFAALVISNSATDWTSNPSIILLDTTDYPVTRVNFPTVTICRKDNDPNRMQFPDKIINFIKFPCFEEEKPECVDSRSISFMEQFRQETKSLLRRAFDNSFYTTNITEDKMVGLWSFTIFQEEIKTFASMVVSLMKNTTRLEIKNIFKKLQSDLEAMSVEYFNTYSNFIIPQLQTLLNEKNVSTSSYLWSADCERRQYPNCMFTLTEAWKFALRMEFVYPRPFPLLGDFISSFDDIFMPRGKNISEDFKIESRKNFYSWIENITNDIYGQPNVGTDISELASFASYYYLGYFNRPNMTFMKTSCSISMFREKYAKLLRYMEGNLTDYPCKETKDSCCFVLTKRLFVENAHATAKYLKNIFTNQGQLNFFQTYIENSSFWKQNDLQYIQPNDIDISNSLLEMILFCEFVPDLFAGKPLQGGCKDFRPVPTPAGVCFSYNAQETEKVYKNHSFWSKFNFESEDDFVIHPAKMSGSPNGFFIVLNVFEPSGYQRTVRDFRLAITNPETPFDIAKSEISIKPGFVYRLKVMPSQIVSTPGFDEMSIADRNCRLPHESEHLTHFRNYTKSGCIFECAMEFAYNQCFCLPWSFPHTGVNDTQFCDIFGNVCFAEMFQNKITSTDDCNCLKDCMKTTYTTFETQQPLSAYLETGDYLHNYVKNALSRFSLGFLKDHLLNSRVAPYEKEFVDKFIESNIAIVKIEMASDTITRTKRDRKVSLESQISALGGTLGLFCGMSLLSAVEILVGLISCLKKFFYGQ